MIARALRRAGPGPLLVALGVSLAVAAPHVALANGRFPQAQQLVVDPSDANHITVETTYGFLETDDHGKGWRWICEAAAGYGGSLDPPIAILGDGTLIAGVFDGLSVSPDRGCTFTKAQASGTSTCQSTLTGFAGRYVVDVARLATDPARAIAISSNGCGMGKFDTRLWSTSDDAKTWAASGVPLPDSFLALTADVAASSPSTIYVSGFRVVSATDYRGAIAVTTDAGATWQTEDISGSTNTSAPYIAAIDPADAKTFYVRLASDQGQLLVTHDAGATFTMVFQATGKLLGFALSPDGKHIVTGGETDGVMAADVGTFAWKHVSKIHDRCLTWSGTSIYGCGSEALDGFTIGESKDGGATWAPLHHLSCLPGPVGCGDASDVAMKCAAPWAATSQTLMTSTCTMGSSSSSSSSAASGSPVTPRGGCTVANGGSPAGALAVCIGAILAGAGLAWRRHRGGGTFAGRDLRGGGPLRGAAFAGRDLRGGDAARDLWRGL